MIKKYEANLELESLPTNILHHLSQLAGRLTAIPGKQPWLPEADSTKGPQKEWGSQLTQETFHVLG